MSYGLPIWCQTNQSVINQIECLYNRALKILDGQQIRYHHCQIFSKYKILSFAHFVFLQYVKFVFKCLNGLAPQPLCNFFERLQRVQQIHQSGCKIVFCKTSFAQPALSVKCVKLWNSLPNCLKSAASFNI